MRVKSEKKNRKNPSTGRRRESPSGRVLSGRCGKALDRSESDQLLRWFDAVRRDLSWRRRRDPYSVLVSEVMLQQTRVEVVERYYEAFLASFPDVRSLANASEEEVLARWSGLGYYRRARNLHRAARVIAGRGTWPRTAASLRELPGIGEYTAAAVASIAFGEATLALDGNVERVLARRIALDSDPKRALGRRALERAGLDLVDGGRAGDSNQALMELGATLCRPRSPHCDVCPLSEGCAARALGRAEDYPMRRVRRQRLAVCWVTAIVERDGRILLLRRPPAPGLMDGLWNLPTIELEAERTDCSDRELARRFAREYGGRWSVAGARARAHHSVTYRDIDVLIVEASIGSRAEVAESEEAVFVEVAKLPPSAWAELPTGALVAKALEALFRARAESTHAGQGSARSTATGS